MSRRTLKIVFPYPVPANITVENAPDPGSWSCHPSPFFLPLFSPFSKRIKNKQNAFSRPSHSPQSPATPSQSKIPQSQKNSQYPHLPAVSSAPGSAPRVAIWTVPRFSSQHRTSSHNQQPIRRTRGFWFSIPTLPYRETMQQL